MRLRDLSEAPISGFTTVGDFEQPGSIGDRSDRRVLKNDVMVRRIKKAWERTPVDFNLVFINLPAEKANTYRQHVEVGRVFPPYLEKNFPEVIPHINDKAVNIVFTNNRGDERVSFTPWIIAHRVGHALSRPHNSMDSRQGYQVPEIQEVRQMVLNFAGQLHRSFTWNQVDYTNDFLPTIFHHIGTMKSAREQKLIRPGEFLHELFAQYLLRGSVRFNPLTVDFLEANTWIDETKGSRITHNHVDSHNERLKKMETDIKQLYDNAMQSIVGMIFVM